MKRIQFGGAIFAASVVTLLSLHPASGAGPTVTMTPNTNLRDSQRVTVSASGFPIDTNIELIECEGTMQALPKDTTACDGITGDVTGYTDTHGNYLNTAGDKLGGTNGYRIFVLPTHLENGTQIRCGPANPCVLYIGVDFEDFHKLKTFLPLNFAGSPAPSKSSGSSTVGWALTAGGGVVVLIGAALVVVQRRRRGRRAPNTEVAAR